MADRYEHETPGPVRWWRDVSSLLNRSASQIFVEVQDIIDREARVLGCVRLCSPLYITGTATAFTTDTDLTGDGDTGYNYSLTVFH